MKNLKFIFAGIALLLAVGFSIVPVHRTHAAGTGFDYWVDGVDVNGNYIVQSDSRPCSGTANPCHVISSVEESGGKISPDDVVTVVSTQDGY